MAHQTPAQRAANLAFRKKQESRMGKRAPPAPAKEEAPAEKPTVVRKTKKHQKPESNTTKIIIAIVLILIWGSAAFTMYM